MPVVSTGSNDPLPGFYATPLLDLAPEVRAALAARWAMAGYQGQIENCRSFAIRRQHLKEDQQLNALTNIRRTALLAALAGLTVALGGCERWALGAGQADGRVVPEGRWHQWL